MPTWEELRHQREENLRNEQEKESVADKIQKEKKPSPHSPILPCPKCGKSHRKGDPCKPS